VTRVLLVLALLAGDASAHGRDPYAFHIEFRPGAEQDVLAGTTIGLVTSHDGGATWRWTCEEAVHYQDPFEPDYAYAPDGTILAQTFNGLGIDRHTCSFLPTQLGALTVSAVTVAGDAIYVAAAETTDSRLYRSTDGGTTFEVLASPGQPGDWWRSLAVAPGDPQRIYLSGYRFVRTTKQYLLFASSDGGATFDALDTASFAPTISSLIEIVGIGSDPDVVYARVTYDAEGGDAIYKSIDGGTSWAKIFASPDPYGVTFLARASGELVVATRTSGAWRSADGGASWQALAMPPHISTLAETSSGEVWAGTQSYKYVPPAAALPEIPSDGYAIMKSADLVTWQPVLRMQDLAGPACEPGTDIHEQCAAIDRGLGTAWCCLVSTLGITSMEGDCVGPRSCGAMTQDIAAGDVTVRPPEGCCQGSSRPGLIPCLLVLIGLAHAYRPRRAARCRPRRRPRGHRQR
jgi:photosystem II stability/assembly factor-like uncharacterized protein